jgi:hypothetical protein
MLAMIKYDFWTLRIAIENCYPSFNGLAVVAICQSALPVFIKVVQFARGGKLTLEGSWLKLRSSVSPGYEPCYSISSIKLAQYTVKLSLELYCYLE